MSAGNSRRFGIGPVVVAAIATATGFLPLFGAPGYEQALLAGLWVPGFAAVALARQRVPWSLQRFGDALARGAVYALAPLFAAYVHVLRGEGCGPLDGTVYYAWTSAFGIVLGALWGAIVGAFASQKQLSLRASTLLAIAGPLTTALLSLGRFFTSPMIFAFDPFVGFFSGTLYDTVVDPGVALYTYRLGSVLTVAAIGFATLRRHARGRARYFWTLGALAAACASAFVTANGPRFGHWHTKASIETALGDSLDGRRCRVVYPSGTPRADAELLLTDCEAELDSAESWLELPHDSKKLTAFFFRDAAQKRALMGAEHTYVAKPWRDEVYLQLASFPHPVLGHEIAHVVAGRAARGPFRIGGAVGGLWPNPGLIEGVASAVSPDDDELTDPQWARALLEENRLPPIGEILSFRFFSVSSAKSYTVAGAFITWVKSRFGAKTVTAWYGGTELPRLTGLDWAALDTAFRAWVQEQPFPPAARSYARGKFERPGLFGRKCPHAVDTLRGEGDRLRGAGDEKGAICKYDAALALDGNDWNTRLARAATVAEGYRGPSMPAPLAPLEALLSAETPAPIRDRAEDALAEAAWFAGDLPSAAAHWNALAARTLDEDAGRNFEVKALASSAFSEPRERSLAPAIGALILGDERHRGPNALLAGVRLGALTGPAEPLAHYLLGKNLMNQKDWRAAERELFHPSTGTGTLATARLGREMLRQRAVVSCILHTPDRLEETRRNVLATDSPFASSSGGRRESLLRFIARCAP